MMTSTSDSCKDGVSKSSDDVVCEVNDMLNNMSTNDNNVSICANCGKEGDNVNNICNKCKMVKYCNAACKKKHRHKHKKECEQYVAELHDEALFKQPPYPHGDCPICFLRLPLLDPTGKKYHACCGKVICSGCCYAPLYDHRGNVVREKKCPFCRTPLPKSNEENIQRYKKRVEAGDPIAMYNQGSYYREGRHGFPQDTNKALELFHRAAELGHAKAYCSIGSIYYRGQGVEIDTKRAVHYYEIGAISGDETARYCLGLVEKSTGNLDRAIKHFMIAVVCGDSQSINKIKQMYSEGCATKEDYKRALHSYQEYLGEIKSEQRDKAAESNEDFYRYY